MKKNEIAIGGTYLAKVSDRLVAVRIDRENPNGGWDATNQLTNKKVRIKSAQRLRGPAPTSGGAPGPAADPAAVSDSSAPPAHTPDQAAGRNRRQRGGTDGQRGAQATSGEASGGSGLDAAAKILKEAGAPLRCKDLVETMLSAGLWKTNGKTPIGTIHAAICREIKIKGEASRFQKTGRGFFAYRGN